MMLYMANWGTSHLMFRIPYSLINIEQIAPFCISEEIDHWPSNDQKNIILDLNFQNEDDYDLNAEAALKVRKYLGRIKNGNFSRVEVVGKGIYECKIDFGPGYRVYFGKDGKNS